MSADDPPSSHGLATEPERQALLQALVEMTRSVFASKACSIMSHDVGAQELMFEAVAGEGAGTLIGQRMPAKTGVAGWVLASEEPLAIADVRKDPRWARDVAESTGFVPTNLTVYPLLHGERSLGVLSVLDQGITRQVGLADTDRDARRDRSVAGARRPPGRGRGRGNGGAGRGRTGARRRAAVAPRGGAGGARGAAAAARAQRAVTGGSAKRRKAARPRWIFCETRRSGAIGRKSGPLRETFCVQDRASRYGAATGWSGSRPKVTALAGCVIARRPTAFSINDDDGGDAVSASINVSPSISSH